MNRLNLTVILVVLAATSLLIYKIIIGQDYEDGNEINGINNSVERTVINEESIEIVFGGDVNFDLSIYKPRVMLYDYPRNIAEKIRDKIYYDKSLINGYKFPQLLLSEGINDDFSWWEKENFIAFDLSFENESEEAAYPFRKISEVLSGADISFVNLESPLADEEDCRVIGYFVSKPIFARSLKSAGVDLVSVANNHAWDASEKGFLQTLENLKNAEVEVVGGGNNIYEARQPVIFEVKGTRIGFIGYSQQFKYKFMSVADHKNPGIAPYSLSIIKEDIENAKKMSDLVFVSIHWDLENTTEIHQKAKEAARYLIDVGADGIIGHHSHIPKGVEIYKGRPIIYSLGNFIFGHDTSWWKNNMLVKIIIDNKAINRVEIIPISGRGEKLYQPEILRNAEARELLKEIAQLSSSLDTVITIENERGIIEIGN